MATYDAPLYADAFEQMETGRKTVYALVASDEYRDMVAGDRLEFCDYGSISVGMVRRYPDLEALVESEGWQCLVPDAEGAEQAIAQVRSVGDWVDGDEKQHGVLALRVREARRK